MKKFWLLKEKLPRGGKLFESPECPNHPRAIFGFVQGGRQHPDFYICGECEKERKKQEKETPEEAEKRRKMGTKPIYPTISYKCPNCKSFVSGRLIEQYFGSGHEGHRRAIGSEGYNYRCPICGCVVFSVTTGHYD